MKTKFYALLILFVPLFMAAQNPDLENVIKNNSQPYFTESEGVERNPLEIFLCNNFNCPKVPYDCLNEGTVVISFKVNPSGKLSDFVVSNSVCPSIDKEFIRVLKKTEGMWSAGSENGKPVTMEKEIAMIFVKHPEIEDTKAYLYQKAKANFMAGGKALFVKGNPKKALKYYDESIKYRPNDVSSLLIRGICRYELGDEDGACMDWNRIVALGGANEALDKYLDKLCEMKGFETMSTTLNEKIAQ